MSTTAQDAPRKQGSNVESKLRRVTPGRATNGAIRTRPSQRAGQRARLLTLAQAGEWVQLSRWTLGRAIERGELEGFRFGRRIRVSEEALEAWIKAGVIEPEKVSTSMGSSRARRSKLASNHFRQIAKEGVS